MGRVKNRSVSKFEKLILVMLFLITMINYIDRSALSYVVIEIEKSFQINSAEFGLIASAFGLGYLVMTACGGRVVDRFGTIGIWAICAILWSIATVLLGFADSFVSFLWIRIFLGFAEGIHFIAVLRTVRDWLPSSWLARASALGLFGIPVASIIGAPLSVALIALWSWQVMFFVLGGLGIVWALLWLRLFRKHPKVLFQTRSLSASPIKQKLPWKMIFSSRSFLTSCLLYFANSYTVCFMLMWLPGYLLKMHHVSLSALSYLVLPPWIFYGVFLLMGGGLADFLFKRTTSLRLSRTYLIGVSLLLSGLCFLPLMVSNTLFVDLFWISLGLGLAMVMVPAIWALNVDLFGSCTGTAQGLMLSCGAVAWLVAPSLSGWFIQISGNFKMAFVVIAVLSITTALLSFLLYKPDQEKRASR